jgi:hypothetical protein
MSSPRSPSVSRLSRRRALLAGAGAVTTLLSSRSEQAAAATATPSALAAAELRNAAERGELCSALNATGTGLRGEYFARDPKRGAPVLVRVDATIDFDSSLDWPAQLADRRPVSARWTGWVKPPIAGRYRFHAGLADARVVVARQVLVGEGAATDPAIEMAAGRFYTITVEASRLDAMSGRLQLEWTAPFGARYVVPRALLFVPNEDVPGKS